MVKSIFKFIYSLVACMLIIPTIALLASCSCTDSETAIVGLDINPSIELIVDGQNKVVAINAKNNDADQLIASIDISNLNLDQAISTIVESCMKAGQISFDNANINISVDGSSTSFQDSIANKVSESINRIEDKYGITINDIISKASANVEESLNNLKSRLQFLSPELSDNEIDEMSKDEILEALKSKSIEMKNLTFEELNNINNTFTNLYSSSIETIRTTIQNYEDQINNSQLDQNIKDIALTQLNAAKEALNTQITQFENARNQMIAEFNAQISTIKADLESSFEELITSTKVNITSTIDIKLDNSDLTQEQYDAWKVLFDIE